MSTEIGTLKKSGSRNVDLQLTRYYGGTDNGVCIQLTAEMQEGRTGYVQLSAKDIVTLIPILNKYLIEYSDTTDLNTDFEFSTEIDTITGRQI